MSQSLTALPSWHALEQHRQSMRALHLRGFFAADPEHSDDDMLREVHSAVDLPQLTHV